MSLIEQPYRYIQATSRSEAAYVNSVGFASTLDSTIRRPGLHGGVNAVGTDACSPWIPSRLHTRRTSEMDTVRR